MSLKGKNILIDVGLALFPTYRKVLVLHSRERKKDLVVKRWACVPFPALQRNFQTHCKGLLCGAQGRNMKR